MSIATSSTPHINPALRIGTRLFNPLMMLLAGTRWLPAYGVMKHYGRRSGKTYRTPVVVQPTNVVSSCRCRGASAPIGVATCVRQANA